MHISDTLSLTILITLNSQVALSNCNCSIAIDSNRKRIINVAIVSYQRKHQYENNWQTNKASAVLAESATSIPTVFLLPNSVKQDSEGEMCSTINSVTPVDWV